MNNFSLQQQQQQSAIKMATRQIDIETEITLIKQRLQNADDLQQFAKLLKHCNANAKATELCLVVYRHLLPEIYDAKLYGTQIHPQLKRPICVGYLVNEDIIVYNELDSYICNFLRNEGALVIPFRASDFCYKASTAGIEVYIKDQLCTFDGFLSYGYRKQSSMETYLYISKIMEEKGIACLHDDDINLILNNKLLQSVYFAKSKVPIPDTYQTFDVESTKALVERVEDIVPCVAKNLNDYAGDGVTKLPHKWNIVNTVSKSIWRGDNVILQKFISDSIGRSIRVLCFNNKAFSIIEFNSLSGDFRSNYFIGDQYYRYTSLMDHEKFEQYRDIAEHACASIGDLCVAGVDLIDSESHGVLVIEINSWPELFESWETTGLNTCKKFAETFIQKTERQALARHQQQQQKEQQQQTNSSETTDCYLHNNDLIFQNNLIIRNPA